MKNVHPVSYLEVSFFYFQPGRSGSELWPVPRGFNSDLAGLPVSCGGSLTMWNYGGNYGDGSLCGAVWCWGAAHQQCGEDSNPRMLTLARDGDIHVGGGNHFLVNQLESVFFA